MGGMVLAGVGHVDGSGKKNFLIVDSKTHQKDIEEKFNDLTARKDIAMILITQGCADLIRHVVDGYGNTGQVVPTVLEIPSKEQPYGPRRDAIMSAWPSSCRRRWHRWAWTSDCWRPVG